MNELKQKIEEIFKQEYKSWYRKSENVHRGHIPYTAFRATEKRILALLVDFEKSCKETEKTLQDAIQEFKAELDDQKYALAPNSDFDVIDHDDVITAFKRIEKVLGDEKSDDEPYLERREREDLLEEMGDEK